MIDTTSGLLNGPSGQMTIIIAASAPMKPATEPTLRSIWPETITSSMPSAITMMKLFCCTRLLRFTGLNSVPIVVNWKNTMMTISASIRPYSRRLVDQRRDGDARPCCTSSATPVCGAGAVSVLMMLFLLRERWRA